MSFSSTGYEVEKLSSIMNRIYEAFIKVLPNLEFTPDNILTHWQEILAYEQRLTQVMLFNAIQNFSVLTATGIFLDRLGIEAGVIRKDASLGAGDIIVYGEADTANSVESGAVFSTSDGRGYYASAGIDYTDTIQITRSDSAEDDIPSPYTGVTLDGLYTDGSKTTGIATGYYSVTGDVIYWNATGIASGVTEGTLYYASATGIIGAIVPVVAEAGGADYNVSANKINVDSNSYSFVDSLTNPNPFYNGYDIENDTAYRLRISRAKRKTFSLGRIESLSQNINGVRESKAYQITNTDKNSLGTGLDLQWDINNLTGLTGNIFATSGEWFGFSFVPTDDVATLKELKLYGRTSGETVPKLEYYIKPHYDGAYLTDTGYYLSKNYIEKYDLERDTYNTFQEITLPLKYNGLDNAKSYKIYLRESGYVHDVSGCWQFIYSGISVSPGYNRETYLAGTGETTKQMLYRTMYGAPAYNLDVVVEDGYRFDPEIKDVVEKLLNYEIYDGNSPVCIQYDIRRATKTYLSLTVDIYLNDGYVLENVSSDVKTSIGNYLRTVKSGEKVVYSSVEKAILNTDGVFKLKNMRMRINSGEWSDRTTQDDLSLSDREYVDLDLLTLYNGVSITEG